MDRYNHFTGLWQGSGTDFPAMEKSYPEREKRKKEKQLDAFISVLKGKMGGSTSCVRGNSPFFFKKIEDFFKNVLDYNDEQLEVILSADMIGATLDFVDKARQFDPLISPDDVFQACRNAWIMNGIQYLLGTKISLTPSIFAYSMLYPYSDNLIDDPEISTGEKTEFSLRFESRLNGNRFKSINRTEEKIHELVEMIEGEWDRKKFPEVYKSLLDIHQAQTNSIQLLSAKNFSAEDIFRICAEKGGRSVVADGCLLTGKPDAGQEQFLYDYGAWLQLLDDMQDASDDLSKGLITYFSGATENKKRFEEIACRTFHLGFKIMNEVDWLNNSGSQTFKSLMKKSTELFVIESVATNYPFFDRHFIRKMETYSPFHFSFLRKKSNTLESCQKLFFRNIENFALGKTDENPATLTVTV